ncbi:MAG: GNAT family N-acetyltransferase [Thaumarchaeota archaeon]|nr:GNAT family N-acetyltransferase [Nitrososphaerota archaeon]
MADITIRELCKNDLQNGFLESLDSLRMASDLKKEQADEIFQKINVNPDHIILVAEVNGKIVGCLTIIIEQKFIHKGGMSGHIEDVAVNDKSQKMGIGKKLISYALEYSKSRGCYKTVLHCTDDVRPFYEKLGFRHNMNGMRFEHT